MSYRILPGDVLAQLATLPDESVNCCVTSPPYWGLRNYGVVGQIGLEATPELYTSRMTEVFREIRRVLRADGTLWLNLGDSYAGSWGAQSKRDGEGYGAVDLDRFGPGKNLARNAGSIGLKPKDLVGIPWRVAFALQADGWYLRSDIIWSKPNPMPESVTDRPTKAHEYIFLLSKGERYFYDHEAIKEKCTDTPHGGRYRAGFRGEDDGPTHYANQPAAPNNSERFTNGKHSSTASQAPGHRMVENVARARATGAAHDSPFGETRNKRTVWTISTQSFPEAHFATFPEALIEPCILAGCPIGGTVLDPFSGSGTTGVVALRHQRQYIGIELNPEYVAMSERRFAKPDQVEMELTA